MVLVTLFKFYAMKYGSKETVMNNNNFQAGLESTISINVTKLIWTKKEVNGHKSSQQDNRLTILNVWLKTQGITHMQLFEDKPEISVPSFVVDVLNNGSPMTGWQGMVMSQMHFC